MKLDDELFSQLLATAGASARLRAHLNLHQSYDEPVQRLCIALQHGSYVRPHRHVLANKWELIMALRGEVVLVQFDSTGAITDKTRLTPGTAVSAIELAENSWHCLYVPSEHAVIMEVKPGPYSSIDAAEFASWAPAEGESQSIDFLSWLYQAQLGDRYLP